MRTLNLDKIETLILSKLKKIELAIPFLPMVPACFLLLLLAYSFWTLDRGFEITDEAYYLLLAKNPDSVNLYISAQQWIMAPLWNLTGSLSSYRLIGLLLLILSGSFLAKGAIDLLCSISPPDAIPWKPKMLVYICSIASALLYGSTINFSPCYNLIASAAAYIASGAVFLALAKPSIFFHQMGLLTLGGSAIALEFISKASAGICTLGLLSVVCIIYSQNFLRAAYATLILISSSIAVTITIALNNGDYNETLQNIQQGINLFKVVQTEGTIDRILRYIYEYTKYIILIATSFFIPLLCLALYIYKRRVVLLAVGFTALILTLVWGGYFLGGADNRYPLQIMSLMLILFATVTLCRHDICKHYKVLIFFLTLFLIPYTVAMGTGNQIFTQVIVSLAPWGVCIALMCLLQKGLEHERIATSLLCGLFIMLISVQTVTSSLRSPYHMNGSLWSHSIPIEIGNIGRVRVDSETYNFVTAMLQAKKNCDIQSNDPVLALYNIPGAVLTLSGTAPVSPWINNPQQAAIITAHIKGEAASRAVLALQLSTTSTLPDLPPRIATKFPEDYNFCGKATYPFHTQEIEVWAPKKADKV